MKNTVLGLVLVLFVSACAHQHGSNVVMGTPQTEAATQKTLAAQKSAEEWLALVDAGKYAESWQTAAGYFQKADLQDKWEQIIAAVRSPLGDLVSRQLKSARYTKSLTGAPDGKYVVLKFDTSFANKKTAVETVTTQLDADRVWKVMGYYIN